MAMLINFGVLMSFMKFLNSFKNIFLCLLVMEMVNLYSFYYMCFAGFMSSFSVVYLLLMLVILIGEGVLGLSLLINMRRYFSGLNFDSCF
uniref:NADH dehydrogenase subunit 4L n=1 Tax=Sacculina confragosa TaxID=238040 RepID=UPI002551DEF1|nr:NADH dehydrogenase subunit 4L [Sacculina confragosa]WGU20855.1 NADH dehydrogenase subunit 4L [Sacculina confragosa]